MLPSAPGQTRKDDVFVNCFFYGFYMSKEQIKKFSFTTAEPLDMTPKTSFGSVKRADTTRQHLDSKADEEDGIPIRNILAAGRGPTNGRKRKNAEDIGTLLGHET